MITTNIPLIDRIALESYYTMIKSNPGLFTNEGVTTKYGDNISLFREISDDKINSVIKDLHEVCDRARTDYVFTQTKGDELHEYKIEGTISNFRDYTIHKDGNTGDQLEVSNMVILNLYAVDVFTGLSAKNTKYRIPVLFTLINHNDVPSILLIKSSIDLSHSYCTCFNCHEKDIKMYKIIPLSSSLLSDIAKFIVRECFNTSTDSLITISYNKIGTKYNLTEVNHENKLMIKRVLADNNIPTAIIDGWDDSKIMSMPIIDFSDDFSGSELEIDSLLCKNEYNLLEMTNFDDFKENNSKAILLSSDEASKLILNSNFDYHEDFTYTINGRAYTIESDKYVETEKGYDVQLVVKAENEYAINRIGALELIPLSEVAHTFEDTLLSKSVNGIKEISKFTKDVGQTAVNAVKNKKEAIDYLRTCDSKIDHAFKVFVSVLSGVTAGSLLGPATGALAGAITLKNQLENKIDKNKAQKDMTKLYNNHISFLDEKIEEAKSRDNTKLAIRFEKGKLAYENKIAKLNLAIEKEKKVKNIKKKYKGNKDPYNR